MPGKTYYRKFRDGEAHRFTRDLIHNQIPSFYVEDGPKLIELLQQYYTFMHKNGNAEAVGKNLIKLNDIDELTDFYNQYLEDSKTGNEPANTSITTAAANLITNVENLYKSNYLLNFPTNMVSFEHLVKNVLSIYRAKGSERAFETLMRGIYNIQTEISYPFERTIKASDGVYQYDAYVQTVYDERIIDFKDTFITGQEGGARAFVEDIVVRVVKGKIIAQLIISKSSLTGIFRHNEIITSSGTSTFGPRIIAGIREINLTSNGSNYIVGDKVNILGDGLGGIAIITEVEGFAGQVRFTLNNGGSGYQISDDIIVTGPTSGTEASARIGSLKDLEVINIALDRVGALASNSQITLNQGPTFHTNTNINAVSVFTNSPIAGPALAGGVRANWIASSNDVHLSTSIANNTIINGAIITIGNTSIVHNEQLKVHDFFPGNNTIRFTSQTSFPASNSTGHVRIYAANSVYRLSANMASANISSKINASFANTSKTFGSISTLIVSETGSGYTISPTATVTSPDVSALNIPDGFGGFKGRNAVIDTEIVRDAVITKVLVDDHGLGYTNTTISLSNPRGGTSAIGTFVIGGTGNSAAAYTDVRGFLSENQKIQDSFFYQAFSYEAITNRSFDEYEKTMISLTHPAGSKLFGRFRAEAIANATPSMIIDITQAETTSSIKSAAMLGLGTLGTFRLNETAF